MWKWVLGLFLVLVLGCGGAGFWLYNSGQLDKLKMGFMPGTKPATVRLEKAARGDLVRTVSAPGLTEPRLKVSISAQVSARIIALPFREGQFVKKGDVVVRLDARDLVADLESAKAQLKSEEARLEGAKAALANAAAERTRLRLLYETKDVSKAELDTVETDYARAESTMRVAEFAIEIAKANIDRAKKDLDNSVIEAPFDGKIVKLNAEVGELVVVGTLNNAGSVIMQIADLSVMLVKAKVDEANVAPVKVGQKALVTFNAFGDEAFEATVENVALQRQQDRDGTVYFETQLLVKVPATNRELFWGLTSNADIQVETIRDVIKVPSQAIVDRQVDELPAAVRDNPLVDKQKKFARVVYKLVDGKAVSTPVTIGPSDLTHTVVTAGVEAGETIIAGPYKVLSTLKDGALVQDETTAPPEKKGILADSGGKQ